MFSGPLKSLVDVLQDLIRIASSLLWAARDVPSVPADPDAL